MTQEEKRICAQRLFDEIGNIDDRFITEAAAPYARARDTRGIRAFLIGAVSVALAISVTVGVFVVGMMSGDKKTDNEGAVNDMNEIVEGSTSTPTLSARLTAIRNQTANAAVSKEDIDLFDGMAKIIWKYSDEEEYRTRDISDSEYSKLKKILSENKGVRVDNYAVGKLEGVWIASGDGLVISPCLEQTAGNVGYGEIFDYVPEYEPSAELSECLCDYIS